MVKVAINGFGRIGRNIVRAMIEKDTKDIEIVLINDLMSPESLAYLLQYDSTFGQFKHKVSFGDNYLDFGRGKVKITAKADPADIDYKALGVDLVLECSGFFRSKAGASKHLSAGAKKVLISAPGEAKTVVYGVNHQEIQKSEKLISNASCTTNALAPLMSILDREYGVKNGFMTTIHSYTSDQALLDKFHSDPRRGRSAAVNMVPTSTGAALAIGKVLPQLEGKLNGVSIRVPTVDVSIIDLVVNLNKSFAIKEVNGLFEDASKNKLAGILEYCDTPLVSSDFLGNSHSTIFDASQTYDCGSNMLRISSWYDNEFGFSNRMIDVSVYMVKNDLI